MARTVTVTRGINRALSVLCNNNNVSSGSVRGGGGAWNLLNHTEFSLFLPCFKRGVRLSTKGPLLFFIILNLCWLIQHLFELVILCYCTIQSKKKKWRRRQWKMEREAPSVPCWCRCALVTPRGTVWSHRETLVGPWLGPQLSSFSCWPFISICHSIHLFSSALQSAHHPWRQCPRPIWPTHLVITAIRIESIKVDDHQIKRKLRGKKIKFSKVDWRRRWGSGTLLLLMSPGVNNEPDGVIRWIDPHLLLLLPSHCGARREERNKKGIH